MTPQKTAETNVYTPSKKRGFLVVLGGGESGVGTAILAKQKGFEVFVSDSKKIKDHYKEALMVHKINFEENQHHEEWICKANIVMKSPGIPDNVPLIKKIIEKGIPIISEIEFASQFTHANIIGITGSNGKTTTTLLTTHILKKAGLEVEMGGNIGKSFAQLVAEKKTKNYVLELSSFQLDGIKKFNSHIAIITNISPDHLDRYEHDFTQYIASKFRITKNQTANDYLIYDADDKNITAWLTKNNTKATLVPFSIEKELDFGAFIKENNITINLQKDIFMIPISSATLRGKHNTKNVMAASLAARLLKVRNQTIKESLEDFEGAEHRLEFVAKINGVEFINDSKATNINATFYALECMDKATIWIVGGKDKGNDYTDLLPLVREKVKAIVCLGIDNQKIKDTFSNVIDMIIETAGADEAVKVAKKLSEKGDVVLLSPACASFDLFDNFEDRGRQFKNAVRNL